MTSSAKRPANDTNTFYAASYSTFDAALRFTQKVMQKSVTLRVGVDNLTNERYWSTVAPSNLTGANTGNLLVHFGAPRTLTSSMAIVF